VRRCVLVRLLWCVLVRLLWCDRLIKIYHKNLSRMGLISP